MFQHTPAERSVPAPPPPPPPMGEPPEPSRPDATLVLAADAETHVPEIWAATCLAYAATREGLGEVVIWEGAWR